MSEKIIIESGIFNNKLITIISQSRPLAALCYKKLDRVKFDELITEEPNIMKKWSILIIENSPFMGKDLIYVYSELNIIVTTSSNIEYINNNILSV